MSCDLVLIGADTTFQATQSNIIKDLDKINSLEKDDLRGVVPKPRGQDPQWGRKINLKGHKIIRCKQFDDF